MKKFIYLFLCGAVALSSCNNTPKEYCVTGTVEIANDGEKVYLMERVNRQFSIIDSAVISIGKFVFTGVQDIPVHRYLSYTDGENDPYFVEFFLENGNTEVELTYNPDESLIKGTKTNNIYQSYKKEMLPLEMAGASDDDKFVLIRSTIDKNATNALGLYLLDRNKYRFTYQETEAYMNKLPRLFHADATYKNLEKVVANAKATAVGEKFTDLSMLTPDGDPIKLSDYAGKGKIVLVDFWASWCPPCRAEMPKLVEAYAEYKDKGFEIVGVSLDRAGDAWKKGIEQLGITWPQMSDLQYWNSLGSQVYSVNSIPHLMLIDKDGTIIDRGFKGEELKEKLKELLD